jgi:hypothetical protein
MKKALKLALEGAANYIDALGGDSRKYRQALAAPTVQKRPPNCGTGYCSCVECVMEPPAQPAPVQEEDLYDLAVRADNGGQP